MKHYIESGVLRAITRVAQNVVYIRVPDVPSGSEIVRVDVWCGSSFANVDPITFDIHLNGETIFAAPSDRPIIGSLQDHGFTDGLSVEVALGDIITLDVDDLGVAGVPAPIVVALSVEDHASAGLTTEQVQDIVAALLAEGANVTITYDDAGNALEIASSGGGASGFGFLIDAPPAAPDALNDEFDGTGSGWTDLNFAESGVFHSEIDTFVESHLLTEKSGTNTDNRYKLKVLPAGDFTIITKSHVISAWGTQIYLGLAFTTAASLTGTQYIVVADFNGSASFAAYKLVNDAYISTLASTGSGVNELVDNKPVYFRVRRESGVYYQAFSKDGLYWRELASFTPSPTPNYFGIVFGAPIVTGTARVLWDFIRYFPTATAQLGRKF